MTYARLYGRYVWYSNKRKIRMELTREQFAKLVIQNCHYCGIEPRQKERKKLYNGLDRKDNTGPYATWNVVPCCKACNWIKGVHLTYDEMVIVSQALRHYRDRLKPSSG